MSHERTVHFIGIGGIGMSGIARQLLRKGVPVSGSDIKESPTVIALRDQGAVIYIGHRSENVQNALEVVTSTAVKPDNPEVLEAKRLGIRIMHRSQKLAQLVNAHRGITIAGTHGKTTTSSMAATLLNSAGLAPSFVIGGIVNSFSDNSQIGETEWFVIEADESDGSLVEYRAEIAVLTNIEMDHMDYFRDADHLHQVFSQYLSNIRPGGVAIYCADDPGATTVANEVRRPDVSFVSYGVEKPADISARDIDLKGMFGKYTVYRGDERLGLISLRVPGLHNVQNSLAAVAIGLHLGLPFEKIAAGMHEYHGVQRRFQIIGHNDQYTVVDDYAHHPSEIKATLSAARASHNNKRIIGIFQPHRYSRTHALASDFGSSFGHADEVIVTDIYAAGEEPIPDVTSGMIVDKIKENSHPSVCFIAGLDCVEEFVANLMRPNDMVITLGAGDVWKVARNLTLRLIP
jgi:UDP-N-acetylmuramate--alanine ligase